MKKEKLNYAAAGVDIAAADKALEQVKTLAKSTFNDSVLSEIGSFGGFFKPDFSGLNSPVLISSTDSVGTKLKLAFLSDRHDTIGEDLVNHCVNDILVHGARPLFFLDYIGVGKLKPNVIVEIVAGLARACKNVGMALIGGEMAELHDFYSPGEYDVAGCIVGVVDQDKVINGSSIKPGDVIIGLGSTGLHTNGYTLARKIAFDVGGYKFSDQISNLDKPLGEALMSPHRCYLTTIQSVIAKYEIAGMAHITGGGIKGNLIRILPDSTQAVIDRKSWPVPPIFKFLQKTGSVAPDDMFEAFNMGIGYIVVADPEKAENLINDLKAAGEATYIVGEIKSGAKEVIFKD